MGDPTNPHGKLTSITLQVEEEGGLFVVSAEGCVAPGDCPKVQSRLFTTDGSLDNLLGCLDKVTKLVTDRLAYDMEAPASQALVRVLAVGLGDVRRTGAERRVQARNEADTYHRQWAEQLGAHEGDPRN